MKKAFVDIGTNTVLLLLVDVQPNGQFTVLADECHIARLGEGLSKNAVFLPAAQERVITALTHFQNICKTHHCDDFLVVGTAAFRKAQNGADFVKTLWQKTGFAVQIISGEEEARLIAKATLTDFQNLPKPLLTLDIGGGSTEFIVNDNDGTRELFSLPFGAVRLHEEFLQADPPSEKSLLALRGFIKNEVRTLLQQLQRKPMSMVATAGTPTTVAALLQKLPQYDATRIHKSTIAQTDLETLLAYLVSLPLAERQKIPCLPKGRADVIIAGALILSEVMQAFGFDKTAVSDKGLRHGLLLEYLESGFAV